MKCSCAAVPTEQTMVFIGKPYGFYLTKKGNPHENVPHLTHLKSAVECHIAPG